MPVLSDGGHTDTHLEDTEAEERFIRVEHVLDLPRKHPPSDFESKFKTEPTTLDDFIVARQRNIQAFHLRGPFQWADYRDVEARFRQMIAEGKGLRPYPPSQVFAPIKVLLAEHDRPIRATLAYEPVFAWNQKLATLKPGQQVWLAYAAVAVLNSELGLSFYREELEKVPVRARRRHGLNIDAVRRVPVARHDYTYEQLGEVAELTHQLITLHQAQSEFLATPPPRLHKWVAQRFRDLEGVFQDQIGAVSRRLNSRLPRLLGIGEIEEHQRLGTVNRPSVPPDLSMFDDLDLHLLQRLPPQPPAKLLTDADREMLEVLLDSEPPGEASPDLEALLGLQHWEEAANTRPPRYLIEEMSGTEAA